MTENLVCPECGHDEFAATLTTRTEYTYQFVPGMQPLELSETVIDGGDVGDAEGFVCQGCFQMYDYPEGELILEVDYLESLEDA